MFKHVFITQLKVTLRAPDTVFWTIAFPFILAILFHFAFGNLDNGIRFKPVPVAVVDSTEYDNTPTLKRSVEALSSGDQPVLAVTKVSKTVADDKLQSNKVDGIIEVRDGKPIITVKNNGFSETIIASSMDQSLQVSHAIVDTLKQDPRVAPQLGSIGSNSYITDVTNKDVSRSSLYFYTLIGMACIYAGIFGIMATSLTQANLSKLGLRMGVSPASRMTSLLAGLASGFVIAYAGAIALYLFMTHGLGVQFGAAAWSILLVVAAGVLAGLSLGTLIATVSRGSEKIKSDILVAVSMAGSFLAGMMGSQWIKYLIDQHASFFAAINPVNLVSDALLATYYFGIGQRFIFDVVCLFVFSAVSIIISWLFMRRRSYASL